MESIKIRTARPEDAGRILEIYAYYIENTAITFEYAVPTLEEFENRICHTLERYPYLVVEMGASSIKKNASHLDDAAAETLFAPLRSALNEHPLDVQRPPFGRRQDAPSIKKNASHLDDAVERRVMGYAYAGPLKERAAYDWACELSIYLDREVQKQGLGRILYEALEARLKEMGILNLYACIACPQTEREVERREDTPHPERDAHALQSEIVGITRRENIPHEDPYLNWNSVDFHAHLGYRLVGTFYKCGYKFGRWYDMVWMEKMIGEHEDEQLPVWFGSL